jgi:threonine dehydrogenase-like Zn-dependent dehydrogenase
MRSYYVSFPKPYQATLEEMEISPDELSAGQALVKGYYSVISAGTELAHFTALEDAPPVIAATGRSRPYPRRPGYGHLGEVVACGLECGDVAPGDVVLTFSEHASLVKANVRRFHLKIPATVDARRAVCTRMAGVAITALRSSSVSPGDHVVVIGLGLVGNLAAQLLQLAGAEVLGADLSSARLEVARRCGIRQVVNPQEVDLHQAVQEWTDGRGASATVEAIGRSELVAQAVEITRRHGEVILLGSPRASVTLDVTPMLLRIHLQAIRLIGALEWTYPLTETERVRFSISDNYRQILRWIAEERLIVDPLITHILSPWQCQQAYDGLLNRKDEYVGVLFDWKTLADA